MEPELTNDKKMAILMGASAMQLALALEGYYQSHQQNGDCACDLCRSAAIALSSSKFKLAIPIDPTAKVGTDPEAPKS
jgi:hypothetical protein